jgi:S-adenosylmethionine-diacylgycerolhomoserine-N-methlytransferase
MTAADISAAVHMDRMYRYQRHIYDRLIAGLDVPSGGSVLEVGCGTGRNLVRAAKRYPEARLFGFDISSEMLDTAASRIASRGLTGRIRLAEADATSFAPGRSFGEDGFDRVFLSFTLSMIPEWERALAQAWTSVRPGGSLHVVDFGQQNGLPVWFRALLFAWLTQFSVTPRALMRARLQSIADQSNARLEFRSLYRGYSELAVLTRR